MSFGDDFEELRQSYLDLVKKIVGDFIYDIDRRSPSSRPTQSRYYHLDTGKTDILRSYADHKYYGLIYPQVALSMIGMARLNQLQAAMATLIAENIPGDFLEAGVWRGGACLLMRAFLKAYQITDRQVWLADSFRGFPASQKNRSGHKLAPSTHQALAVSLAEVQANFEKFNLWDKQISVLEGYFSETLPQAPVRSLALLRLDADFYEPTQLILDNLYPKLSPGGYLIVDDYFSFEDCRRAVEEYRSRFHIQSPLIQVDPHCVYWRKSSDQE